MIRVVLLGGGNVAYHLTKKLITTEGIKLVQVYNRSLDKIQYLEPKTLITNNLSKLKDADVYIIAISDDAICSLSSALSLKNKLVIHTSGSMAIDDLHSQGNKGVLYLLQSFSKNREIDFSSIPICIEAENKNDLELLRTLAYSLSNHIYEINSIQRKKLHVAAVFVNNFVNHLYHIGSEICAENNVPFEILHPLIIESAHKIKDLTPFESQTGPAKRKDEKIIKKHITLLDKNQQEIYKLLTKSIQSTYGKKL
jgi:predicted short-subunit dehydrogenase-like oxidoreductase (DUF2520 family)